MKKDLTNTQHLAKLIKELNPIETAIMIERLYAIAEATDKALAKDATKFYNPIFNVANYFSWVKKVKEELAYMEPTKK